MWEPFGTTPANTTAFWQNGPNERGTLNILSICVITLLLCAYTSLHLDIPDYRKVGWIHRSWERFLWVLAGLAAPEFVAFIACLQWICARKLEDQMTERLGRLLPKSTAAASQDDLEDIPLINDESAVTMRKEPWTRVHSHFALMGGFVFDTSGINPEGTSKRDTLTPQGLRKIAESAPSVLPDLSKGFIRDKSKANSLAKFLVCVQTIWFIAQTIGRLATGYPISLLELNTLCHAFCCLFIYMAWWHKPLDIEEPYLMNAAEKHTGKVWAWMVESDHLNWQLAVKPEDYKSSHKLYLVYEDDIDVSKEEASIKTKVRDDIHVAREYNRHSKRAGKLTFPDYNAQWDTISDARVLKIYPGQNIHGFVLYDDSPGLTYNKFEDIYTTISADRVNRLRLIDSLRRKEGSTDMWSFTLHKSVLAKRMLNEKSLLMSSDATLMSWKRSRLVNPTILLWSGVLVAGSLYGGVHLFAWNGPFPTRVQRILWRISCIIITSPAILIVVGSVLIMIGGFCWILFELIGESVAVVDWMVKLAKKVYGSTFVVWTFWILVIILMVAAAIAYVGARLYLVIECFINVAHLPQGVFVEPNWSMYIPHFGAG